MITQTGTDIAAAVKLLNDDEIVAIPTETVYGLAGNALSEKAIAKIYAAKDRPQFNPLIMHLPSCEQIEKYAEITDETMQLLKQLMPGPFTILLQKKNIVPDLLTAGSRKVAIRVPAHSITRELLSNLNFPLAAPSANPSGYISPVTAQHVYEGLNGKISYILDGGECSVGLESTIAEIIDDEIIIHRLGGISIEDIKEKTGLRVQLQTDSKKPVTSGQLKSHYAPATPLIVGDIDELILKNKNKKIAVISFRKEYTGDHITNFILSAKGDYTEAASKFFSTLRKTDNGNFDIILAEVFPNEQLGPAINDRLNRAQHKYK